MYKLQAENEPNRFFDHGHEFLFFFDFYMHSLLTILER